VNASNTTPQHWATVLTGRLLPALAAFTIPLPIRVNSIVSVLVLVFYCFLYFKARLDWRPLFRNWLFVLVAGHFAVLLIGLAYTPDLSGGLAIIERYSFALLCVGLVYIMGRLGVTLFTLLSGFALGVAALVLYGFAYAIFVLEPVERALVIEGGHVNFANIVQIHPTYLGMYLIFIFFVVLEYARLNQRQLTAGLKWFILILLVGVVMAVVFLRSQINLFVFPLLVVIYGIVMMRKRAALITFLLFTAGFLIYLADSQRASTFYDRYGKNVSSALENRIQIWKASVEAFQEAPFFGSGTGGAQTNLNVQYSESGFTEGVELSYNAHNQYLQILVRNGLFEFIVFMSLLAYCFYRSLQHLNYSFLIFIILFTLTMMAESCLSVQKGIVFFYFFAAAFLFLPENTAQAKGQKA
jgi:O-antigen ligase